MLQLRVVTVTKTESEVPCQLKGGCKNLPEKIDIFISSSLSSHYLEYSDAEKIHPFWGR
jgi:hypothetical protein